jgi:hypothetical protein
MTTREQTHPISGRAGPREPETRQAAHPRSDHALAQPSDLTAPRAHDDGAEQEYQSWIRLLRSGVQGPQGGPR